jgi:hypothetical protein
MTDRGGRSVQDELKAQCVTSVVTLVDVVTGTDQHPAAIRTASSVRLPGGGERVITEQVPVPDVSLLQRLMAEVTKGDRLQVTVETDWSDPDLPTRLIAFTPASVLVAGAAVR